MPPALKCSTHSALIDTVANFSFVRVGLPPPENR